jgi:hypothetical protein
VLEAQHQDTAKTKQERQDGSKTRVSIAEESNSITVLMQESRQGSRRVCMRAQSAHLSPYFVGAEPTRRLDSRKNIEGILDPRGRFPPAVSP